MLSKFFFGTIYSGGLSSYCFSTFPPETQWGIKQSAAIIGFWNIFMVPVGNIWNKVNEKILKKIGLNPVLIKKGYINKSSMMIDFLMNHLLFQAFFVGTFYTYLNYCFPNPSISWLMSKEDCKKDEKARFWVNIVNFRIKISVFSAVCDLWFAKLDDVKTMKLMKAKNFGLQMVWHLYIIHKYFVESQKKIYLENIKKE